MKTKTGTKTSASKKTKRRIREAAKRKLQTLAALADLERFNRRRRLFAAADQFSPGATYTEAARTATDADPGRQSGLSGS